ncbi:MAG TPA: uroporphyrinogen-III synthase, partial [Rhizomicrobium sp.]|nr:uroporphyrinogen-III synthase [Rhizomicrobium sp.]
EVKAALRQGALDAAMFFSPRTARIFAALSDGLPTQNIAALCISPATAQALPPAIFARVAVAQRPNQEAMLALVE